MKKLYTLMGAAVLTGALTLNAQQVPNGDFEGAWGACTPWVASNAWPTNGNTKTEGVTPADWTISNVIGINGTGKTSTGEQVAGRGGNGSAVRLFNAPNSTLPTQTVPGYITLGTTWSTSVMGKKNDGGSWGGVNFTYRPDALQFYYKRSRGTAKPNEPSTVVAYLWSGEFVQENVPASIVMLGNPKTVAMVNRDRCVLDYLNKPAGVTSLGGDVTKKGTLVASLIANITENADDWTLFEQPLEYKSDAAPEMMNIILAAGDYFGGASVVGKDNSLTVDDVKFVYYSRLKSLSVGNQAVALKDGVYNYELDATMPTSSKEFVYNLVGQSAKAEVALDNANKTATITVSNVGADNDGQLQHVYTVKFTKEDEPVVSEPGNRYNGTVTVGLKDIGLADEDLNVAGSVYISEDKDDSNKCTIKLPNFSLGEGADLGDIVVPNVTRTATADGYSYSGVVNPLVLHNETLGDIYAKVTVKGTTVASDGKAHFNIDVLWLMDPENDPEGESASMPIKVEFNGVYASTGIIVVGVDNANAPVEYYDLRGVRVSGDNMPAGIYIRRQGNKVTKISK